MFGEYQIRAALIKTIKAALSATGISGYEVLARNPQNMTNDNDVVLIDKISSKRRGFQGHAYWKKYDAEGQVIEFHKAEQWIEEIMWQFSVIHKRETTDGINTQTGEDVVKRLVAWLNSEHGAAAMRGREDVPFAPFRISETRSRDYLDDSEIHQKDEQFDFTICVLQTLDDNEYAINGFVVETHPV